MNYSPEDFARLTQGEDVDVCYRETFLHYRFLKHPDQQPKKLQTINFATQVGRYVQKITQKLK
jgi:hypothetical protein